MPLSGSCNFSINQDFYSINDITWSFQYKALSAVNSSVGFCTFLYDSLSGIRDLSGGYGYSSLGFGPSANGMGGITNAFIVAGVDSTGLFGTSSFGFSTGLTTPIPNSLTIRTGTNYLFLTSIHLSTFDLPALSSSDTYNTLRFRLTNSGQTFVISKKEPVGNSYIDYLTIATNLTSDLNSIKRIGFSFATPVTSITSPTSAFFKDIHYHGVVRPSDRIVDNILEPYIDKISQETFLMATSGATNPSGNARLSAYEGIIGSADDDAGPNLAILIKT